MPFSQFELPYGRTESFVFELETDRVMASLLPPKSLTDVAAAAREALQSPIDLPPLSQALVTGDKVVLCVDRSTPQVPQLIAAVWAELDRSGIAAEDVLILHAAGLKGATPGDPRGQLPREVAQKIQWKKHDPGPEEACAYLATTASGERIYLASEVVHADFVMCLGAIGFDPLLGYRGTLSCLYPGLSTTEAMRRMWGGGHVELEPHDPRPLREIIEEIGWLLGTQYHLQVLPGPRGGVAHVFAGAGDAVLKQGKQCLDDEWKLNLSTRPEL
ncbi:MAG: lactate racemase domain-containing protein, partial [Planctomycetaceae bacterium]